MKANHVKTLLILAILAISGIHLYAQKEADQLKSEIKKMNDKMIRAEISGDIGTTVGLYADDAILMPNNEPMIRGKQKMMDNEKKQMDAGYKMMSMNLNTDEIYPDSKYVIEVGHYVIKMKIPGMAEPMADNGKYVTVWERQKDGSLKIFIDTWNTDVNPMEMHNDMMNKEKKEMKK